MFFRLSVRLSLAALIATAAVPVFPQVVPAATEGGLPLEIGGGLSSFGTHLVNHEYPTHDYITYKGDLLGPAAWADWYLYRYHLPSFMRGFGIEVEGRHLAYDNSGPAPLLKEDTGAGGIIYMWRHYHNFHPYGKMLRGFGSIDFLGTYPGCTIDCNHDSDTFYAPGGGVEVHLMGNLWVRGDYEAEFWTHFGNPPNNTIYPHGFTVGVSYDLRHVHAH
jgi:opacity protein-like surface antigen